MHIVNTKKTQENLMKGMFSVPVSHLSLVQGYISTAAGA